MNLTISCGPLGWLRALATIVLLGATILGSAGCSTTSIYNRGERNEIDPFEPYNRTVYAFNDGADRLLVKPVATVYKTVTPELFRFLIGNFFDNLGEINNGVNNLLQGKLKRAGQDALRFAINTTFGFGGLADVASDLGLERSNEDLGQTLGYWGIPSGPYLVIPVLGPSTARDLAGTFFSQPLQPLGRLRPTTDRAVLYVTQAIDTRAYLLGASELVDGAALDSYTFVRNAYIQRRLNLIYDGNPPFPKPSTDDQDPDRDLGKEPIGGSAKPDEVKK
jgi:phospholipid-binding lipoprotein MlaA